MHLRCAVHMCHMWLQALSPYILLTKNKVKSQFWTESLRFIYLFVVHPSCHWVGDLICRCLSFHLLWRLFTYACQLLKTLNCDTMEVGHLIRKTLSLYLWSISKCFQSLLMSIWTSVILVLAVFLVFESVDYQKQRGSEAKFVSIWFKYK